MAATIQIKRGTSGPINLTHLLDGELAYDKDNNKLYIGKDGSKTVINSVPTAAEVGADPSGSANTALTNAKVYTDTALNTAKSYTDTALNTAKSYTDTSVANLINSAPTTLDTLGEIATAMNENAEVVDALEASIGTKANASDLTSHTGNKSNPHGVTLSQLGVSATATELNYVDGVTSNIQTQLNAKAATSAIPTKTSQLTNDSGFKTTDNNTTYTISKSGSTITLTGSDGKTSSVTDSDTNTTYSAATTSAAGLMSAADKTKLDGIATGANKYSHPTSSGNKHIPSGGSSGQILRWSADGTAVWGADNNTTYSAATTSAAGLMSAADKTKLDGIAANANNYILPAATTVLGGVKTTSTVTSTSGLTACPIIDGTVYYKDTNTTYSVATQSANGLMSANDKKTLDGMTATTTTPKAAGTAAVGSETKYARGDHVHPAQTTVSGNAGSATKLATARNFTIGKTAKSFNGTAAVSWTLDEIGSNVYVGTTAPTDADVDVWVDPTGSINLSALWNSIYPVGSIYMSTSSTNPGTLFTGTTWSQISDRFLVGMGSTYTTAGGTGGASSVTLATGNLPSHRHSVSITSGNQSAGHTHSIPALSGTAASAGSHNHLVTSKTTSYGQGSQSAWRCLSWTGTNADWTQNIYSGDSGAHTHSVTTTASTSGGISANHTHSVSGNTGYQGSGTAFSIIPPYYAVYMWRRTA